MHRMDCMRRSRGGHLFIERGICGNKGSDCIEFFYGRHNFI